MEDDFHFKTQAFLAWFHNRRTITNPKITLADLRHRNAGRGLVATSDIAEDEELFSLSRADILCVENSDFVRTDIGRSLLVDLEDQWTPLILVMIFEFLRESDSPWKPYFDILPTNFNSPMFWSDDELDQLQASAVRLKIGKQEANDNFLENVITPIRRNTSLLFPNAASLSDQDLLYLAHRMGSTIMAYAFDIEKDPSQQEVDEDGFASDEEEDLLPKGMIPMADMLNADADRCNARLFYGKSAVTMRALKPIKAGEEILNDYGPLPRADLLRRYGYITPNYTQYDVVEIPRQLVIDVYRARAPDSTSQIAPDGIMSIHCTKSDLTDSFLAQKFEYLNEHDALDDGFDISRNSEDGLFPPLLLAMMWTLDLPEADFLSRKNSMPRQAVIDPKKKESVRFLGILCDILQARLNQYVTSLQDDDQLAQVVEQTSLETTSDFRKAMALYVRIGEKQILLDALIRTNSARDEAIRKFTSA